MNTLLFYGSEDMLVLITYDVQTTDSAGRKRLREVAKECQNYGQRVQNSVFECNLDAAQFAIIKRKLEKIVNPEKDSLRIYNLGDNYRTKVYHYGAKESFDLEGVLMI